MYCFPRPGIPITSTLNAIDLEGDAIEYYIPTTPEYDFDGLGSNTFSVATVQDGSDYYAYLYFLDNFEVDREVRDNLVTSTTQ